MKDILLGNLSIEILILSMSFFYFIRQFAKLLLNFQLSFCITFHNRAWTHATLAVLGIAIGIRA
ncbi:hypothetical protein ACE3NQ_30230, partial [Paenibacillus terreus]